MQIDLLTSIDDGVILLINNLAQKSQIFDRGMNFLAGAKLVKIVPFAVLLWWFWFRTDNRTKNRLLVLESVLAGLLAIVSSRLVQILGPDRPRPRYDENLNFVLPFGSSEDALRDWSSFPSDHAALVFAFATALFFHHRRLGILALLWCAVVIGFPRIYVGYHYPSDMIAGAAIGAACGYAVHRSGAASHIAHFVDRLVEKYPAWFYAGAFLFTYQLADMFDQVRSLGRTLVHSLKYIL